MPSEYWYGNECSDTVLHENCSDGSDEPRRHKPCPMKTNLLTPIFIAVLGKVSLPSHPPGGGIYTIQSQIPHSGYVWGLSNYGACRCTHTHTLMMDAHSQTHTHTPWTHTHGHTRTLMDTHTLTSHTHTHTHTHTLLDTLTHAHS